MKVQESSLGHVGFEGQTVDDARRASAPKRRIPGAINQKRPSRLKQWDEREHERIRRRVR